MSNMIKCNECEKNISNKAKTCPHCGIKTQYGINESKKMVQLILIIICVTVFISIITGIMLLNKTASSEIVGVWSNSKPFSRKNVLGTYTGVETTIYTFSKDGSCNERITEVGTRTSRVLQNEQFVYEDTPHSSTVSNNCNYSINLSKSKLTIFYLDDYNECLEIDDCAFDRSDYEEIYSLSIGEKSIFIDGNEYLKNMH